MNFYPHHIGDYLTATAHLSWCEDCAYRRLLDVYYSRERAIPADIAQACRLVRATSKDERKAVETVLTEFFTQTADGWRHGRCDAEIVKAAEAAERARANGKKGGRPPRIEPTANPEETQPVISGNPEKSKSQAPITNPNPITNPKEKTDGGSSQAPTPPPAYRGEANEAEIPKKAVVTLANDWELPEAWGVDAEKLGWPAKDILHEAEKFRQYYTVGKGGETRRAVKGWRQAWSNWLSKASNFAQLRRVA